MSKYLGYEPNKNMQAYNYITISFGCKFLRTKLVKDDLTVLHSKHVWLTFFLIFSLTTDNFHFYFFISNFSFDRFVQRHHLCLVYFVPMYQDLIMEMYDGK